MFKKMILGFVVVGMLCGVANALDTYQTLAVTERGIMDSQETYYLASHATCWTARNTANTDRAAARLVVPCGEDYCDETCEEILVEIEDLYDSAVDQYLEAFWYINGNEDEDIDGALFNESWGHAYYAVGVAAQDPWDPAFVTARYFFGQARYDYNMAGSKLIGGVMSQYIAVSTECDKLPGCEPED